MKKTNNNKFTDNLKTLGLAILAALTIRSFLFEPFSIPSGSMYPTLVVGDYLFVSKYSYGFSRHSFPLSAPVLPKRILYSSPKRGDVIVFKTPTDNKTDYIKRLIGLPGDTIKMVENEIFLNGKKIERKKLNDEIYSDTFNRQSRVTRYMETLPSGKNYEVFEMNNDVTIYDTNNFRELVVPDNQFYVIGDNRDNSQDSRFIGGIPKENLVGQGALVFLSFDPKKGRWWKVWSWFSALRKDRFFTSLFPNEGK